MKENTRKNRAIGVLQIYYPIYPRWKGRRDKPPFPPRASGPKGRVRRSSSLSLSLISDQSSPQSCRNGGLKMLHLILTSYIFVFTAGYCYRPSAEDVSFSQYDVLVFDLAVAGLSAEYKYLHQIWSFAPATTKTLESSISNSPFWIIN